MATDLTNLALTAAVSIQGSSVKALDLSAPADTINVSKAIALLFGTGANKANQVWHDRRVLAGGANEELDLAGVLTNAYGATVTFANVCAILIINRSDEVIADLHVTATDANIDVGGAAANGFLGPFVDATDKINLPAGAVLLVATPTAAGWTVTAGTVDLLKVENKDADDQACYDVVIAGESA